MRNAQYLATPMVKQIGLLALIVLLPGCRGYSYEVVYGVQRVDGGGSRISEADIDSAVGVVRTLADRFSLAEVYDQGDDDPFQSWSGYRSLAMAITRQGTRYEGRKVEISVSAMVSEDRQELRFNVHDLRNGSLAPPAEDMSRWLGQRLEEAFPAMLIGRTEEVHRKGFFAP